MHLPNLLSARFEAALAPLTDDVATYASMIRPSGDVRFGDYQCNAAMPLAKSLSMPPREVAQKIVENLTVQDLCATPEIAGPGFINLRLRDDWINAAIVSMLDDPHLAIDATSASRRVVIDFSSPNIAKPMHVGHIRSTVIGDSLARTLRFLGAEVITDNHLGDWGTQFGIIIYGVQHFGQREQVRQDPVPELSRLYRLTNQLIEYQKAKKALPKLGEKLADAQRIVTQSQAAVDAAVHEPVPPKELKKLQKSLASAAARVDSVRAEMDAMNAKLAAVDTNDELRARAEAHPGIAQAVLDETAKLHRGDPTNVALWNEFLPHCKDEINRVYDRLKVQFDHTLGESFYHERLAGVVQELQSKGLTKLSDGAVCVFLPGFDSPMIIQKRDGAYLYATTDLATLQYRRDTFAPTEIVYVVDSRQSEHFVKLFAMAGPLDLSDIKLVHVDFGTVLGADGRPMKTRSGTLIGLEGLLNDAVAKAMDVVCNPARLETMDPPMEDGEQHQVAEAIGIGAIKYADLSHHRSSDYKFDVDKMVAMEGNTATYIQYSYARTQSILRKAQQRGEPHWQTNLTVADCRITEPAERALALQLIRFQEALQAVATYYTPNVLCDYLYETAKVYSTFNEQCRVLGNEDAFVSQTRFALVRLTGRVLHAGLELLGIDVVDRM